MNGYALIRGDALRIPLRDESVDAIITSPPYFALRSYQDDGEHYAGQIGSEPTPADFLAALWAVSDECYRVLKPTGSMFVDLGDKYAGSGGHNNANVSRWATAPLEGGKSQLAKRDADENASIAWRASRRTAPDRYNQSTDVAVKSLMGLPWRYALGLSCPDTYRPDPGPQWTLRAELIWSKPNGLPESVTDRVRRSHETWFHLTNGPRYYAAVDEIREAQQSLGKGRPWSTDVEGTLSGDAVRWGEQTGTQGLKGHRTTDQMNALNPLGKLPGSVWTMHGGDRVWTGQIAFCPACGKRLTAVGSGQGSSPAPAMADAPSPDDPTSTSTGSATRSSSAPSPTGSPSTTSVATGFASDPTTSRLSPDGRTSSGEASHSKPIASTAIPSPTPTSTDGPTVPDASVGCAMCSGSEPATHGSVASVWTVPSEPLRVPDHVGVDHFAAFPQELVRRLILGWTPNGICTACGEGRRPVVEKDNRFVGERGASDLKRRQIGIEKGTFQGTPLSISSQVRTEQTATITGYACACDVTLAPTRPAVVLDPFVGTGTVPMVARALGRYGIGLDLSRDYLRLARWRISESRHGAKSINRTNRERQGNLW